MVLRRDPAGRLRGQGTTNETIDVVRLDPERRPDFFTVHSAANGCGFCFCVAWWVPSWDGWDERTPDENRTLRQSLFEGGEDDGYLLYVDGKPAAWAQVGPRDRLAHLTQAYNLEPDPEAWAISCFLVAPGFRRRRLATRLLNGILGDLRGRGVRRVEAFPRRGGDPSPEHLWTGPEALFLRAGFEVVRDDPRRPILAAILSGEAGAVE